MNVKWHQLGLFGGSTTFGGRNVQPPRLAGFDIDRKTFLGICRQGQRYANQARSNIPWINAEAVKDLMPQKASAHLVAGLGGGDEELTFTMWEFPTNDGDKARGVTAMSRSRLWEIEKRLYEEAINKDVVTRADATNASSEAGSIP